MSAPTGPFPADRPYALAAVSVFIAAVIAAFFGLLALRSPSAVLVGKIGRHDAIRDGQRLATCLDCHLPFVGTPSGRCLSPGCHAPLATGTPPRVGPAMPVRFHAALRDATCTSCHVEHTRVRPKAEAFVHTIVPEKDRGECARCHNADRIPNHAQSVVPCAPCHTTSTWGGVRMEHAKVGHLHCDWCHTPPTGKVHESLAGTCSPCHTTETWLPNPPQPSVGPRK